MMSLEPQPAWRRALACTSGQCVEVRLGDTVAIRDSKQNELGESQPILVVGFPTWLDFQAELRGAPPGPDRILTTDQHPDGTVVLRSALEPSIELHYTPEEWRAFLAGVEAREFDRVPAGI